MKPALGGASRRGFLVLQAVTHGGVVALLLGCPNPSGQRSEPDQAIPGVTVDAPCVEHRCSEGLLCRYDDDGQAGGERCALEPGRCRDDWDCARSVQRCRRFGTRLGVCQDSGL